MCIWGIHKCVHETVIKILCHVHLTFSSMESKKLKRSEPVQLSPDLVKKIAIIHAEGIVLGTESKRYHEHWRRYVGRFVHYQIKHWHTRELPMHRFHTHFEAVRTAWKQSVDDMVQDDKKWIILYANHMVRYVMQNDCAALIGMQWIEKYMPLMRVSERHVSTI
jgi:hypothetical protein